MLRSWIRFEREPGGGGLVEQREKNVGFCLVVFFWEEFRNLNSDTNMMGNRAGFSP